MIDFDMALHCPSGPQGAFGVLADREIRRFNTLFDRNINTYSGVEDALSGHRAKVYAPSLIGKGLWLGDIRNTLSGWGKWQFVLRKLLGDAEGKRFLDLGANNGSIALEILRAGAAEVVGVERDGTFIEQGAFLHKAVEWADGRAYPFHYVHANMEDARDLDLGHFDCVMALCSLYYLAEEEMAATVRHFSNYCSRFVLQCNHEMDIGRKSADTYRKARLEFARELLLQNGFDRVEVIAPGGYERPIAVGYVH